MNSWWRWLRHTPGWLASAAIHLAAILVLAWLTVDEPDRRTALLVIQGAAADSTEELEVSIDWAQELETTSQSQIAAPEVAHVGPLDPGSPALDVATGGAAVELDGPVGSSLQSIGELFVPGGAAMRASRDGPAKKEAMFYGVKAKGNRFVFIVDSSNSMRGNKFFEAKRELLYALRRLSKDQLFYVIFFDANAERMVLDPTDGLFQDPAPTLAPATVENLLKVERWIGTVQNELKTNPYDAVKFAIEQSPDAIFLLTDGQFTDKGKTLRYLARENISKDDLGRRQVKVVVHTIGFYSRDGEPVLKELARTYQGTYQFVEPPGKR